MRKIIDLPDKFSQFILQAGQPRLQVVLQLNILKYPEVETYVWNSENFQISGLFISISKIGGENENIALII